MHYGHEDLDHYMGGAFGEFTGAGDLNHALVKDMVVNGSALIFSAIEGAQKVKNEKTGVVEYGGEVKIGGKVPLNFIAALGFHAAAFFDAGSVVGIDSDHLHDAAAGTLAVWTTNRGHELGKKWRENRDKAAAKSPSAGAVPRNALRGGTQVQNPWYAAEAAGHR